MRVTRLTAAIPDATLLQFERAVAKPLVQFSLKAHSVQALQQRVSHGDRECFSSNIWGASPHCDEGQLESKAYFGRGAGPGHCRTGMLVDRCLV